MSILTSQSDFVRAESSSWQGFMKSAIRSSAALLDRLQIPENARGQVLSQSDFPVFAPLPFVSRMQVGNLNDPLLRQVIPLVDENRNPGHFSTDPLRESSSTLSPGLLQKYTGRVLLVATGACAIHCRYCFRRHFPYGDSPKNNSQWAPALQKISADQSVEEVILSGGDPLTLVDQTLSELVTAIDKISHIRRIRFHTRLPIMIPTRVNDELVNLIDGLRSQAIFVIHANHEAELDDEVGGSISRLIKARATLLNQSVLLKEINDSASVLIGLSKRLLELGVLPYYLHQLDPVIGASHFEVDREVGESLIEDMRAQLPGYGVPRYVKELAGEPSKTVWA